MKMKESVGKIIGDGKTTKIPEETQTSNKTKVDFKVNQTTLSLDHPRWVNELITMTESWDIPKVNMWCDEQSTRAVLTTHISQATEINKYVWLNTSNGHYTVKSSNWAQQTREGINNTNDEFWKQKIWSKWKYFYWKLFHGALATSLAC